MRFINFIVLLGCFFITRGTAIAAPAPSIAPEISATIMAAQSVAFSPKCLHQAESLIRGSFANYGAKVEGNFSATDEGLVLSACYTDCYTGRVLWNGDLELTIKTSTVNQPTTKNHTKYSWGTWCK
jgi:hypothetical protein